MRKENWLGKQIFFFEALVFFFLWAFKYERYYTLNKVEIFCLFLFCFVFALSNRENILQNTKKQQEQERALIDEEVKVIASFLPMLEVFFALTGELTRSPFIFHSFYKFCRFVAPLPSELWHPWVWPWTCCPKLFLPNCPCVNLFEKNLHICRLPGQLQST